MRLRILPTGVSEPSHYLVLDQVDQLTLEDVERLRATAAACTKTTVLMFAGTVNLNQDDSKPTGRCTRYEPGYEQGRSRLAQCNRDAGHPTPWHANMRGAYWRDKP